MGLYLSPNFISPHLFRTNWHIFTNFIYALMLTRSSLGLLHVIFHKFLPELHVYSHNFVSAQYPENKSTEIHQVLYMQSYWQDLSWNYNLFFFFIFITMSWLLIDVRILFLLNVFRSSCLISSKLGLLTAWKLLQRGYSQSLVTW